MSLPLRARRRRLIVPRGSLADGEAPFAALAHLDGGGHSLRHAAAILLAVAVHAGFGLAAAVQHVVIGHPPPAAPRPEIQASLQRESPAPPPPPAPSPPPRARTPEPHPTRASRVPPAPAQAARVVAQAPAATGPADMTGFDLVVGEGKSYAGGYTAATGTSTKEVTSPNAVVGGVPDAPPPDLSRPATPVRRDWSCAWPEEAQDGDLRDARVTIRFRVGRDGVPSGLEVVSAPPGGFADAARRCTERELFHPPLDAAGKPIVAPTRLAIHFVR